MITLPPSPSPNQAAAELIGGGFTLANGAGGASVRVDRPGARYRLEVGFPPMPADRARVFVSRLVQAKSQGIRLAFPLLGVSQGSPGAAVVDGGGQAGKVLAVRGVQPGHNFCEGHWISITDGQGQSYLHLVAAFTVAGADGTASLPIEPALRVPFDDGAAIEACAPMVEGFLEGDAAQWSMALGDFVQISFAVQEAA